MQECLVLFSGGKDSFLSTLYLIEKGYRVKLVHFDNGATIGSKNIEVGYKKLLKKYGKDKVEYLGTKNISVFIRELINMYNNMYISDFKEKYGNVTFSQLNCLTCRTSMYIATLILCIQNNIKYVADGARKSQLFAIEQDNMLNEYTNLFRKYNIDIIFPVKDLVDDYEEKNEILIRGFVPKTSESQCLIGTPLLSSNVDITSLNSCCKLYNEIFLDKIYQIIDKYRNINIGDVFL